MTEMRILITTMNEKYIQSTAFKINKLCFHIAWLKIQIYEQASLLGLLWPGIGTLNDDPTKTVSSRGRSVSWIKNTGAINRSQKTCEKTLYFLSWHSTRFFKQIISLNPSTSLWDRIYFPFYIKNSENKKNCQVMKISFKLQHNCCFHNIQGGNIHLFTLIINKVYCCFLFVCIC